MFGKVLSQIFPLLRSTAHYSLSLYLRTGKLDVGTCYIIFFPPFFICLLSPVSGPHSFYLQPINLVNIFLLVVQHTQLDTYIPVGIL